jgi:hypothetical protein
VMKLCGKMFTLLQSRRKLSNGAAVAVLSIASQ